MVQRFVHKGFRVDHSQVKRYANLMPIRSKQKMVEKTKRKDSSLYTGNPRRQNRGAYFAVCLPPAGAAVPLNGDLQRAADVRNIERRPARCPAPG
jgi:hypothetical protein